MRRCAAVVCTASAHANEAAALAARLGLPVVAGDLPADAFILEFAAHQLQLRRLGSRDDPLAVDFSRRRLTQRTHSESIVRAVEGRHSRSRTVIDSTAGMGTDAFVLAQAGHTVTLVERHPDIAALLEDGLARAALDPLSQPVVARMRVVCSDASRVLESCGGLAAPEVVYLDPLFPPSGKHALPKKAMQWLRILGEGVSDDESLFALARAVAREKVVVKRPIRGLAIGGYSPTYTVKGRLVRFDVYVR